MLKIFHICPECGDAVLADASTKESICKDCKVKMERQPLGFTVLLATEVERIEKAEKDEDKK